MIITKNEMKEDLQFGIYNITFTKKNGVERVMKGTLMPNSIKPYVKLSERVKTPSSTDSIAVWDVELDAFRSFKAGSVISFEKVKA